MKRVICSSSRDVNVLNKLKSDIADIVDEVVRNYLGDDGADAITSDYYVVEVTKDDHTYARIEVRAEVDYEGLEDLDEALNEYVTKFDSDAYFEPVDPGITECYINYRKVAAALGTRSIESSKLSATILPKDIQSVMKAAADIRSREDLDSVISSLLSIDKNMYTKYCALAKQSKSSPAYLGKKISDELYFLLQDRDAVTGATVTANSNYTQYMTRTLHRQMFGIHYTEVDTSPEADALEMFRQFKATVSEIHPYDDADYVWAKIENGVIKYIKDRKLVDKSYYMTADDWDVENSEWCDEVINQAMEDLLQLNKTVERRMMYH